MTKSRGFQSHHSESPLALSDVLAYRWYNAEEQADVERLQNREDDMSNSGRNVVSCGALVTLLGMILIIVGCGGPKDGTLDPSSATTEPQAPTEAAATEPTTQPDTPESGAVQAPESSVDEGTEPAATGQEEAADQLTSGEFLAPDKGETVGSVFPAIVRIENAKSDMYYWVSVKIGKLHWPKERFVTKGDLDQRNRATVMVHEGGVTRDLELVLLETNEKCHIGFEAWLAEGKRTGSFPGLAYRPGGATTLAKINVVKQ